MSNPTQTHQQITSLLKALSTAITHASKLPTNPDPTPSELLKSSKKAKKLNKTRGIQGDTDDSSDDDDENPEASFVNKVVGDFDFLASFPEYKALVKSARVSVVGLIMGAVGSCDKSLEISTGTNINVAGAESNGSNNGEVDEDETELQMIERTLLSTDTDSKIDESDVDIDIDDKETWETITDTIDHLTDLISTHANRGPLGKDTLSGAPVNANNINNGNGGSAGIDVTKSQHLYNFASAINNNCLTPFKPNVPESRLHMAEGHGLTDLMYTSLSAHEIIAPATHYLHPYINELDNLIYSEEQVMPPGYGSNVEKIHGVGGTLNPAQEMLHSVTKQLKLTSSTCLVDTLEGLKGLVERLEGVCEVAVDLEHHSERSFGGMVCLMQLSIRAKHVSTPSASSTDTNANASAIVKANNFIIDTLKLHAHIPLLAPIFADPKVVKVMHGADNDVLWLQRDFSIYIVNLFDTYRCSKVLSVANTPSSSSSSSSSTTPHTSHSLAYILKRYAGYSADKTLQMCDWRVRPLTGGMKVYAVGDTFFLLDVYDKLRHELYSYPSSEAGAQECEVSIESVLTSSTKVCTKRYSKTPFLTNGHLTLLRSNNTNTTHPLTPIQTSTLQALYKWRDAIARELDESPNYICPNSALVRVSKVGPGTYEGLLRSLNPVPFGVRVHGGRVVEVVLRCVKESASATGSGTASVVRCVAESSNSDSGDSMDIIVDSNNRNDGDDKQQQQQQQKQSKTAVINTQGGWIKPKLSTSKLLTATSAVITPPLSFNSENIGTRKGKNGEERKGKDGDMSAKTVTMDRINKLMSSRVELLTYGHGDVNTFSFVDGEGDGGDSSAVSASGKDKDDKDKTSEVLIPKSLMDEYQMSKRGRNNIKPSSSSSSSTTTESSNKKQKIESIDREEIESNAESNAMELDESNTTAPDITKVARAKKDKAAKTTPAPAQAPAPAPSVAYDYKSSKTIGAFNTSGANTAYKQNPFFANVANLDPGVRDSKAEAVKRKEEHDKRQKAKGKMEGDKGVVKEKAPVGEEGGGRSMTFKR